jgi:hypothetical protein
MRKGPCMDEDSLERRLKKLELLFEELAEKVSELGEREKRLHNLLLRLAATGMAVTEIMQKQQMIKPKEFEKQVEGFLRSLDQEISEKKIDRYLENLWKEFGGKDG